MRDVLSIPRRGRVVLLASAFTLLALATHGLAVRRALAQETAPALPVSAPQDMRWQAVARGRVEPVSGRIEITAPAIERIGEVLVEPHDGVFKGELLVQLADDQARA